MSIIIPAPFNRFQGPKLWGLLCVYGLYTLWYIGPGYFGQLMGLEGYSSLQCRFFYTGRAAIEQISALGAEGRALKYLALIFDVPYMILQALLFEAMIAFGLARGHVQNPKWLWLFILPLAFLLTDAAEDSLLALTLASGSAGFGAAAGLFTALKWISFISAISISVLMGLWGVLAQRKPPTF